MKRLWMNQKGFTIIEMIIAIAISGAIGGVTLTSIYQVTAYQAMDKARMDCVKQVEDAVHYMVRDVETAQVVTANAYLGAWGNRRSPEARSEHRRLPTRYRCSIGSWTRRLEVRLGEG
jgi:prepilin-type N-terminal cleavage/methylation domain-containing protein